ncbi:MAG: hypothetical protein GY866_09995, partial [Proteobacteria bacterium]|nr:hypothetical protein [Pseudomonadota bacterium]
MSNAAIIPENTVRTGFLRLPNHIANLLHHHNHIWFTNFMMDFLVKNICDRNGVQEGCVISRVGVSYAIQTTAGSIDLHGTNITVDTPTNVTCDSGDGWYVCYIDSSGDLHVTYLQNTTVQSAQAPDDSVCIGFAIRQDTVFEVYSFFNKPTDAYLKQEVLELHRETIAKRSNVIVGSQSQKDNTVASHIVDDLTDANLSDGDKVDFLDGSHGPPAANIALSKKLWWEMQSAAAEIDLAGGKTITLSGDDNVGTLIVKNASANSVNVTGKRAYLILMSDNDDCLNFLGTSGTGTILHNGKIVASGADIDGNVAIGGTVDASGFTIGGVPLGTSSDSFWSTEAGGIYYASNVRVGGSFKADGGFENAEIVAMTEAVSEALAAEVRKSRGCSGDDEFG